MPKKRGNSWHKVIDVGRDANGKRIRVSITRPTRREVLAEIARIRAERAQGTYVAPTKMTVGEFLTMWLEKYPIKSPTTRESYKMLVEEHFVPELGHIPLAKLTPMQLQDYYTDRLKRGNRRKKDVGLSPTTVLYHHRVLSRALKMAVRWRFIAQNVAEFVEPPSKRKYRANFWTPEEAARFLEVIAEHRMFALYVTAMLTGLRRGELFGLKWEDVDWERQQLYIWRTTIMVKGDDDQPWAPVTKESLKADDAARPLGMSPLVMQALTRHRAEQEIERTQLQERYEDEGWVFCRPDGKRYYLQSISGNQFRRLLAKADVPRIRFHDLRHTHAAWMLLNNEHPKLVQERLGHSSISVTYDLYGHIIASRDQAAAKRVDGLLHDAHANRMSTNGNI